MGASFFFGCCVIPGLRRDLVHTLNISVLHHKVVNDETKDVPRVSLLALSLHRGPIQIQEFARHQLALYLPWNLGNVFEYKHVGG